MIYRCCDERRRELVRDNGVVGGVDYNGIDFLEVVDADAATQAERQRVLHLHFLKPVSGLTKDNLVISGGERIRGIDVQKAVPGAAPNILDITVSRAGDYSTYTLRLVQDALHAAEGGGQPPAGFDPQLSAIDFSFKVECPSDFDCKPEHVCPPAEAEAPEIDYLARDFNSFRQVMLDRMSVLVPQWQERNLADLGIALVELLAYAGDHLSYQQDVIATEAYLDTARRRVSVRRHAVLVDYAMHDGCNARVWVQVQADADGVVVPRGTKLLTRVESVRPVIRAGDSEAVRRINEAAPETFEILEPATLYASHNEIELYTWSNRRCCLPAGSTSATLKGRLHLQAGDVLVFVERVGPETRDEDDADGTHRHAVRLISAGESHDPLVLLDDGVTPQPLTEVVWNGDDALPFALCISAETENGYEPKVSVALGNIALADHGATITGERFDPVPDANPVLAAVAQSSGDFCDEPAPQPVPPRYTPRLAQFPLTQVPPPPFASDPSASASAVFRWELRDVLPAIALRDSNGQPWMPQHDLLSSDPFSAEFVAEVEEDGRATLRFGDDEYGLRPTPGTTFTATYRVGNGIRGNIGTDSLAHIVSDEPHITGVRNPLPARGGTEPESIEHVRRSAPAAFRIQERAVTADDYAAAAERHREVQRAAATVRWTGSWRTIFLTVDRLGGLPVDATFERALRLHLERFRMAGHDLEIDGPHFVALEIEMTVCVKPQYFRGDVEAALLRVLGNAVAVNGQRGFFHPDNFSFGDPVYLSALYAAAQQVEGVHFVTIDKFQRLGVAGSSALDSGVLATGRLEIARLDNDPNFAERGVLRLTMEDGR
jgi:Baseplate J-like protein